MIYLRTKIQMDIDVYNAAQFAWLFRQKIREILYLE